jgi:CheY-like chemotaxis protein
MDGIAVAENIKSGRPWLPVVIVSGYATADNEARARAAGVSAVLHKPLSPEMIEDSARAAMVEKDAGMASAVRIAADAAATVVLVEPLPEAAPALRLTRHSASAFLAPMLGLVYVLVLPFAGTLTLFAVPFWFAGKAVVKRAGKRKTSLGAAAFFIVAPLVGLAYVLALPFVGLGLLPVMGIKALL